MVQVLVPPSPYVNIASARSFHCFPHPGGSYVREGVKHDFCYGSSTDPSNYVKREGCFINDMIPVDSLQELQRRTGCFSCHQTC